MKKNGHASRGLLFLIAMCLCLPGTLFAQIKVLTSGGFSAGAKVTVYYTEETGKKIAHFFEM
jgi:hypothetical protein